MRDLEFQEQCDLTKWVDSEQVNFTELRLYNASANGMKRHIGTAVKLKRSGVRAGFPDIFLGVAKKGYHGLFIELKVKGGRVSDNQAKWIDNLTEQGYFVMVCYGWEAARRTICDYLDIDNDA